MPRLFPLGILLLLLIVVFASRSFMPSRTVEQATTASEENECPGVAVEQSNPPDGFIDVRQDRDQFGSPVGISIVEVTLSEAADLDPSCVELASTGETTPLLVALEGAGTSWTLHLSQPLGPGESMIVGMGPGDASLLLFAHPGDVNLDGITDGEDLVALDQAIEDGAASVSLHDIDRDGQVGDADLLRLESLVQEHGGTVWSSDPPRRVFCCCRDGVCAMHIGVVGCVDGDSEVACPCVPNPCQGPPGGGQ